MITEGFAAPQTRLYMFPEGGAAAVTQLGRRGAARFRGMHVLIAVLRRRALRHAGASTPTDGNDGNLYAMIAQACHVNTDSNNMNTRAACDMSTDTNYLNIHTRNARENTSYEMFRDHSLCCFPAACCTLVGWLTGWCVCLCVFFVFANL